MTGDVIKELIDGCDSFVKEMKEHGVTIIQSGGETADVGDIVGTIIVDSTVFVRIEKKKVINNEYIKPGHVIVGLASFGKATYEKSENSGISSNGFTAARHSLLSKYYLEKYPEICSTTLEKEVAYTGRYSEDRVYK